MILSISLVQSQPVRSIEAGAGEDATSVDCALRGRVATLAVHETALTGLNRLEDGVVAVLGHSRESRCWRRLPRAGSPTPPTDED